MRTVFVVWQVGSFDLHGLPEVLDTALDQAMREIS